MGHAASKDFGKNGGRIKVDEDVGYFNADCAR